MIIDITMKIWEFEYIGWFYREGWDYKNKVQITMKIYEYVLYCYSTVWLNTYERSRFAYDYEYADRITLFDFYHSWLTNQYDHTNKDKWCLCYIMWLIKSV